MKELGMTGISSSKKHIVIILLLSAFSACAMTYVLSLTNGERLVYSLLPLFLFVALFFLYCFVYKNYQKRRTLFAVITGVVFSFFTVLGANFVCYSNSNIVNLYTWVLIALCTVPFSAFIFFIMSWLDRLVSEEKNDKLNALEKLSLKKLFIIQWVFIFVLWLPTLLASFPGIYGYDSVYQVNYYKNAVFSLHHPIIHSYYLGACIISIGQRLLGSYEAGMLVYSISQMLLTSAAFSSICTFMYYIKTRRIIRVLSLLFFALFPLNPIMAVSSTKNTLFAALFVILQIVVFIVLNNKKKLKENKRNVLGLISVAFLCSIALNQGVYVVIAGLVLTFLLVRKKELIMTLIIVLFLYVVYSGPITKAMGGVKSDSVKEMLSVPIVQISRAYVLDDNELSEYEKEKIEEYIPNYSSYLDNPGISDSMKNSFNTGQFKNNPKEFIQLYIAVLRKKPVVYFDAFARLTLSLWYPEIGYDDRIIHPNWEYDNTEQREENWITINRTPIGPFRYLDRFYRKLTYDNIYLRIPIISFMFSSGFAVWGLLFLFMYSLYAKKTDACMVMVFLLLFLATLFLGPVVLYRYVYPVIVSIPISVGLLFREYNTFDCV